MPDIPVNSHRLLILWSKTFHRWSMRLKVTKDPSYHGISIEQEWLYWISFVNLYEFANIRVYISEWVIPSYSYGYSGVLWMVNFSSFTKMFLSKSFFETETLCCSVLHSIFMASPRRTNWRKIHFWGIRLNCLFSLRHHNSNDPHLFFLWHQRSYCHLLSCSDL